MVLGFIWFHWILLGFTGFGDDFYKVLLGFTVFYWILLEFIGFTWVFLSFNGFYKD